MGLRCMTDKRSQRKCVAILGGSFDPVHLGHIAVAERVYECLAPDELRFMPCKVPPHKQGFYSDEVHRLAMLELALREHPFTIETHELMQKSTSYSVQSMRALREIEGSETALLFVIGFDSLCGLHTWWHWKELFDLVNLVVVARPGSEDKKPALDAEVIAYLEDRKCNASELAQSTHGKIALLPSSEKHISSSELRSALASHSDGLPSHYARQLDTTVADYIEQHQLYSRPMCQI